MNNLENRIEKLEKQTGASEPEHKTWVVVEGEPMPDGIADTDTIIRVRNKKGKQLTERIIAGERIGES